MATVDRQFALPKLAELYDPQCSPGRPDFPFYLPFILKAESVLDVGCGTGELLKLAREAGHGGRLVGLDPADAMLQVARKRNDVEWVLGEMASVDWRGEFDLVVMTGHAFQVYLEDEELSVALAAIRAALKDEGRFVFETRNPLVQEWASWNSEHPAEVTHNGERVQIVWEAQTPLEGDHLTFSGTYSSPAWEQPEVSWSTLRFLDREKLAGFLAAAGLAIEEQFGNWDRSPLTATSPEIITVARAV